MNKLSVIILFLIVNYTFSQGNPNSIWHFGNHAGFTFNTNPASALLTLPTNLGYNTIEGCATVSDLNGNLLLISDGKKIWHYWNNTYNVISTELKGELSSTQNVIILPRPSYANRYYIFTIDGFSGTKKGLYYSEIDLSNGLGEIVFLNKVLKDNLGTPINQLYDNSSENITSTTHSNGVDYWVVVTVQNQSGSKILTYLVSSRETTLTMPTSHVSYEPLYFQEHYGVKISPNNQKIAFTGIGFSIGDFNDSTGIISNISSFNASTYGLEFSPNSNLLYVSKYIQSTNNIICIDVNNPSNLVNYTTNSFCNGLQRGIDGKIYFTTPNSSLISVFNDPNNFSNPQMSLNSIPLTRTAGLCFPQLVSWQHAQTSCFNELSLFSPNYDVSGNIVEKRQALLKINASNTIENTGQAFYHSGELVTLKNGFYATEGSQLHAYILGCEDNLAPKNESDNSLTDGVLENLTDKNNSLNINVLPNPTKGKFVVNLNHSSNLIIEIYDVYGVEIYKSSISGVTEFEVDLSKNKNGLYFIKFVTNNEIFVRKVIKN